MKSLKALLNKKSLLLGLGVVLLGLNTAFAMPPGGGDRMAEHLTESLNLDDEQQATLQTLVEEQRKIMEAQREKMNAEIEEMLSAEQVEIFNELQAQHAERRENRANGEAPRGPGCGPKPE